METEESQDPGFSYRFGQRVKIRPPHPEAGATGPVTNAYLFGDGREEVFVSVPGGIGIYEADELEPAPTPSTLLRKRFRREDLRGDTSGSEGFETHD